MTPTTKTRLLKGLGYSAFFSFAFGLMLWFTFPFRTVADIAQAQARKSNLGLEIGEIGPSLLGIKARRIELTPPRQEGSPEPEPIPIDEVKLRPTLFPAGVAYQARLFGGTVAGRVGLLSKTPSIVATAKGLELGRANAKAAVGLDLGGRLDASVDVVLNPDGTKIAGKVTLNAEGLVIHGGTVAHYDLPKVDLGRLEVSLKAEGGKGTIDFFKSQGADVESSLEGELALAQKPLLSPLKLKLKFKPADPFLDRNSFIKTGLNFGGSRDPRGFYTVSIGRVLGNPSFAMQR